MPTQLCQGDVLRRTPEVDALLAQVHIHFFQKSNYLHFMVLTQTCDLVLSEDRGDRKARYIALAPVRSLESVLNREVKSQALSVEGELPVLTDKGKSKLTEFLARIYNHNELNYFFSESAGTPLTTDCCASLDLSIAIRTGEHYPPVVRTSLNQVRTPPPEFKANCSRLALSLLDFPRATRGSGRFCVCHGVRGVPKFRPIPPRFDSVLLSVLKE